MAAKKVKEEEEKLRAVWEALCSLKTEQEVNAAVAKAFHCTGEAEQAMKECQERFPDANTGTTTRKVREASSVALEAAQVGLDTVPAITTEQPGPQSNPDSTIVDRLHLMWTGNLMPEDLCCLTQPTRCLLVASQVSAVHMVEGQSRHVKNKP